MELTYIWTCIDQSKKCKVSVPTNQNKAVVAVYLKRESLKPHLGLQQ